MPGACRHRGCKQWKQVFWTSELTHAAGRTVTGVECAALAVGVVGFGAIFIALVLHLVDEFLGLRAGSIGRSGCADGKAGHDGLEERFGQLHSNNVFNGEIIRKQM